MKPNQESPRSPEREEDLFEMYATAEDEVEAIVREINGILGQAEDRADVEGRLFQTHAGRLDEATRKAREALDRWLDYVRTQAEKD